MTNVAGPVAYRKSPPGSDGYVRPPALLSVDVGELEKVRWIWTHPVDGQSFVSGYRIVPKLPAIVTRGGDWRHG